jgi:hypothetical protein
MTEAQPALKTAFFKQNETAENVKYVCQFKNTHTVVTNV